MNLQFTNTTVDPITFSDVGLTIAPNSTAELSLTAGSGSLLVSGSTLDTLLKTGVSSSVDTSEYSVGPACKVITADPAFAITTETVFPLITEFSDEDADPSVITVDSLILADKVFYKGADLASSKILEVVAKSAADAFATTKLPIADGATGLVLSKQAAGAIDLSVVKVEGDTTSLVEGTSYDVNVVLDETSSMPITIVGGALATGTELLNLLNVQLATFDTESIIIRARFSTVNDGGVAGDRILFENTATAASQTISITDGTTGGAVLPLVAALYGGGVATVPGTDIAGVAAVVYNLQVKLSGEASYTNIKIAGDTNQTVADLVATLDTACDALNITVAQSDTNTKVVFTADVAARNTIQIIDGATSGLLAELGVAVETPVSGALAGVTCIVSSTVPAINTTYSITYDLLNPLVEGEVVATYYITALGEILKDVASLVYGEGITVGCPAIGSNLTKFFVYCLLAGKPMSIVSNGGVLNIQMINL